MTSRRATHRCIRQRGLSLVELLVGMALGLLIVSAAGFMLNHQMWDSHLLARETQLQQDLRATADLVVRDLRRAGYWEHAALPVMSAASGVATSNPYETEGDGLAGETSTEVIYTYSLDERRGKAENDTVDSYERSGFKLQDGIVKGRLGGVWQPITDPQTIKVTHFGVAIRVRDIDLGLYCLNPCPAAAAACPPVQQVRHVTVSITGQAVHDPGVVRTLRSGMRLRNDRVVGACAA